MYIILNRDDLRRSCKDKLIEDITLFDFNPQFTERINFASHVSFHDGDKFILYKSTKKNVDCVFNIVDFINDNIELSLVNSHSLLET